MTYNSVGLTTACPKKTCDYEILILHHISYPCYNRYDSMEHFRFTYLLLLWLILLIVRMPHAHQCRDSMDESIKQIQGAQEIMQVMGDE